MSETQTESAVEHVKKAINEAKNIEIPLVLRSLLITNLDKWNILESINNDICARSANAEIRRRIIDYDLRLRSQNIPIIMDDLVKKDLIFDPKEHNYRYRVKLTDGSDHDENMNADLINLCDKKIDELLPIRPSYDFTPIDESGNKDDGQVSLEITDKHPSDNFIEIRLYDCSKYCNMSRINLTISKDDFAPKGKHEYPHYEGEEPELVDQNPLGIYYRHEFPMFGGTYLNLSTHGDGRYRITTTSDPSNIEFFSIFVFDIKDDKISSVKEDIDDKYFYQHRYAHHQPEKDVISIES